MTLIFYYDEAWGFVSQSLQTEEVLQELAAIDPEIIYFFGRIDTSFPEDHCESCGRQTEVVDVKGVPERVHKPTPDDLYHLLSCD